MKGQSRIKRGRGFAGVYDYVMDHDDPEWVGGTISAKSRNGVISEFASVASMRKDIDKPVWHESLRLPAGEHIDNDKWEAIGDEFMRRMGFNDGSQYIMVKHNKPDGEHIHIIANRIHPDGSVFYGRNENLEATRIIQQLEKDFDLTITKGPELDENDKIVRPDNASVTKNELEKSLRTGEAPDRQMLQALVADAVKGKPSVREFVQRLNDAGVDVNPNVANKTGKMNGFSFILQGSEIAFSGSKLGDKYKLSSLLKSGLDYKPERDTEFLKELKHYYENSQSQSNNKAESEAAQRASEGINRLERGRSRDNTALSDNDRRTKINNNKNEQVSIGTERGSAGRERTDRVNEPVNQRNDHGSKAGDSRGLQDHQRQNAEMGNTGSNGSIRDRGSELSVLAATPERARKGSGSLDQQHIGREQADRPTVSIEKLKSIAQQVKDLAAPLLKRAFDIKDRTTKAVYDQLNQMRCKTYDIGMRDSKTGKMMNLEKTGDEVLRYIPKMKQMNAAGNDIYIRPGKDENSGLVLIDDIDQITV